METKHNSARPFPVATIYVQPNCPFCEMAEKFLSEEGIAFVLKDVTSDPEAVDELRRLGTLATPIIVWEGHAVIGFNQEVLATLLGE